MTFNIAWEFFLPQFRKVCVGVLSPTRLAEQDMVLKEKLQVHLDAVCVVMDQFRVMQGNTHQPCMVASERAKNPKMGFRRIPTYKSWSSTGVHTPPTAQSWEGESNVDPG